MGNDTGRQIIVSDVDFAYLKHGAAAYPFSYNLYELLGACETDNPAARLHQVGVSQRPVFSREKLSPGASTAQASP